MGNGNNDKVCPHQQGNACPIFDNDNTLEYTGSWVLNTFTLPNQPSRQTSHSTAEPNAGIFIPFNIPPNGCALQVLGQIPTGNGEITANYTIDGGQPIIRSVPIITEATPEFYQQYFTSSLLGFKEGRHNLTIKVLETGKGRNYTFDLVKVLLDGGSGADESHQMQSESDQGKSKTPNSGTDQGGEKNAAIVGGVLGAVIFLLAVLVAFIFWRRRLALKRKSSGQRLPPMMYYTRRTSDGTQGGMYGLDQEAPVIDTDSKFSFRGDVRHDPRRTWVTFSPPPSVPESALLTDRPISTWSSYDDSSVIVRPSHAANSDDASRFSLCTPTTISSMAYAERTLTPESSRRASPASRSGVPVWEPRLGQMFNSRRL